jgi:hypothetical protein
MIYSIAAQGCPQDKECTVKKPPKDSEKPSGKPGDEPFDRDAWEREHGPLFSDEDIDSFLEVIYEARGRKLPDYMRTKK